MKFFAVAVLLSVILLTSGQRGGKPNGFRRGGGSRPDSRRGNPFFPEKDEICIVFNAVDCAAIDLPERELCDSYGNSYFNICEFVQAKCGDDYMGAGICPDV